MGAHGYLPWPWALFPPKPRPKPKPKPKRKRVRAGSESEGESSGRDNRSDGGYGDKGKDLLHNFLGKAGF
jgi:hypothetical protein